MLIIEDPEEFRLQCRSFRKAGETLALVPTMGCFHEGHKSLMRHGRKIAQRLAVSLFVNPTQFGPGEDLASYPRDLVRDSRIAEECGADVLFAPKAEDMFAADHGTWVQVPLLSRNLCGASRPDHFRGVCTVVTKLLCLARPDYAIFGQKDWQQQAIIRRMARDLNLDAEIIALPTMREPDGLAMSSRNVYLTDRERAQAPEIRKGLLMAKKLADDGMRDSAEIIARLRDYWRRALPDGAPDYISIVDPQSLQELAQIGDSALLACAVRLGNARLIDNILIK